MWTYGGGLDAASGTIVTRCQVEVGIGDITKYTSTLLMLIGLLLELKDNKHNAELQWADPGTKVTG